MNRISATRRSNSAHLLIAFVIAASASVGNADDRDASDDGARPQRTFEPVDDRLTTLHPPPGMGQVRALYLPPAISEHDLDRYAGMLNLSEAQMRFLTITHERYVRENAALKREALEALWQQAADVAASGGQILYDVEVAHEQAALYRNRNEYVRRMAAIENRVFDELESILTDEQQSSLDRVRLLRTRQRIPTRTSAFRGAALDLTDLLYRLDHRGNLIVQNRKLFDAEIGEYGRRLTSLKQRHWNARFTTITRGVELLAQMNAVPDDGARADARDARAAILRRESRLEIELLDLNERMLDRLAACLDASTAEAMRSEYFTAAYPRFFPDYHDARQVFEDALSLDELPDDLRNEIISILHRYEQETARLNREMIQLTREYGEYIAKTRRSGGQTESTYLENIRRRRDRRADAAEQAMERLLDLLPPERRDKLEDTVAAYRDQIDNLPPYAYQPEVVIQGR